MSIAARAQVIAMYVDVEREHARALATRVAKSFAGKGFGIAVCAGQSQSLQIATEGARVPDAALLVTVGGDGTLLRAARIAIQDDIPLLGINTGRLGFLTEFDEDDPRIDQLPEFFERGLHVEERTALQVVVRGKAHFALNDAVVRKGDESRIVSFDLCLNEERVAHIPADGVCIATPTGSTAYFLSAGGAIISPNVAGFGIAPLLPHTLFSRPLIVPITSKVTVSLGEAENAVANVETDGDRVGELAPGESALIERYPRNVRFARIAPLQFFSRLEEKMQWGVSIKEKSR